MVRDIIRKFALIIKRLFLLVFGSLAVLFGTVTLVWIAYNLLSGDMVPQLKQKLEGNFLDAALYLVGGVSINLAMISIGKKWLKEFWSPVGASSEKTEIIYVKLLDEGVDVWRPVLAIKLSSDKIFKIIGGQNNENLEGEQLEFSIGSTVICQEKLLEKRLEKVAVKKI